MLNSGAMTPPAPAPGLRRGLGVLTLAGTIFVFISSGPFSLEAISPSTSGTGCPTSARGSSAWSASPSTCRGVSRGWPGALLICVGPFLICWLGVPIGGRELARLGILGLLSGPFAYAIMRAAHPAR